MGQVKEQIANLNECQICGQTFMPVNNEMECSSDCYKDWVQVMEGIADLQESQIKYEQSMDR